MTIENWSMIVSVVVSGVLAVAPWMLMVHTKLAVIANQVEELCGKLEKVAETNQKLWELCARHEARLDTHAVQISNICERLKDVNALSRAAQS